MIDWPAIDDVLLDMDGTLLDLSFDNRFWRELVPARYAAHRGLSLQAAVAELEPQFERTQGLLQWYCLDHWGAVTGLDLVALKHEVRHWISPLPGILDFLLAVRDCGKSLWLVTNAHPESLQIKMAETGLGVHFDHVLSSHAFGAPKEHPDFWRRLAAAHPFDRTRALFADDSMPVLRAAHDYGFAEVIAVRHPDSTRPPREISEIGEIGEFRAVLSLSELTPGCRAAAGLQRATSSQKICSPSPDQGTRAPPSLS